MKRRSQYLRARGGRAVVIGPAPGGGRGVIARGGAAGRAAPARRRSGRRAGPAGQRSAPKQAGRGGDLAGAARRRAVLAAAWLAVCRRCSRARRSAVCWHRAGGRRWHGMQQAGRRGAGRCRRCAAGAGCCRRCSVSGPAKRAKRKRPGRRRVVRRSSRPFLLLLSPRCRAVFAVCRRGQILHLTASRCSGKG